MKININNTDKVEAALARYQIKCTARTTYAEDVLEAAESIERHLLTLLPKNRLKGAVAFVNPHATTMPASYKGTPYSTKFTIERFTTGWFLTSVQRSVVNSKTKQVKLFLTEEQEDRLVINFCDGVEL